MIATTHLARFEFSDQGTKVLMVEWQPETETDPASNDHEEEAGAESHKGSTTVASGGPNASMPGWEVSWPGKSTLLPARDTDQDGAKRRVYFLLPHDVPVPPTVTIARDGQPSLVLKPLPAIFPEKFDAESGSRGVLHTLWAKKRLSELEREMDAEMRANAEGVGLQMAFAEKQWIVDNFLTPVSTPQGAIPMSPRSPIAGRLGEKLKGLRLATSPEDLASPTGKNEKASAVYLHKATNTVRQQIHLPTQTHHRTPCLPLAAILPSLPLLQYLKAALMVPRQANKPRKMLKTICLRFQSALAAQT